MAQEPPPRPAEEPRSEEMVVETATQLALQPGDTVVDAQTPADPNALLEETLLPFSGMVRLSAREMEIVDHPAFQRIFDIFQLGQTRVVYRGATHMRGEHAVGSVQTVTSMADALQRNHSRGDQQSARWQLGEPLSPVERAFVRLGALLHDIGHLPAGHTLEDELGVLAHHDGDERIDLVFGIKDWHGRSYEALGSLIDRLYADDATEAAQINPEDGARLPASALVKLLVSRDHKEAESSSGSDFRIGVCRDLIGNTICGDLLDYLHRDWLHLGKPRHFDPRLLEYLEIRTQRDITTGEQRNKLVINLRGGTRPRPDAVTAILDLLESRYQLSEIALFHRVKLSAAGMLERVVAEYRDTFPTQDEQVRALTGLVDELLQCTDAEMLKLFERKLTERRTKANAERVDGAIDLARRLRVRILHRELTVFYDNDVGGTERAHVVANDYAGDDRRQGEEYRSDLQRAAQFRLDALRALEADFGLRPGEIVMYCPSLRMNHKIAEVGVFANDDVDTLARLDENSNQRITGGHLRAQLDRFSRLWRIAFAIDRDAYVQLEEAGTLSLLLETIERAILRIPPRTGNIVDAIRNVAEAMTRNEASPWAGAQIVEPALNRSRPVVNYPGGTPSVSSFISSGTQT